jgi:glutamine synthetase
LGSILRTHRICTASFKTTMKGPDMESNFARQLPPYITPAPMLPTSLERALDILEADKFYRTAFGDKFVEYFLHVKRAEIARFQLEVTEWEQREYFDLF